ncbi:MAG: hypothetical protein IKT61_04460 [Clostridia bacterium]|nr:hypothetical protein [Clostridia bacterium]
MKNKRRGVVIVCAVTAAAIILAVFSPFLADISGKIAARKYMAQDIKNVDNIVLVGECPAIDGNSQSVAGVKEAVRLGADAVKVDLCFRTDGTPVITDSYENNAQADTVEELFIGMNDEKYKDVRIYLNIVQLSGLSELNRLAVKYNMVGRVYLIGIDESHYGLVTSDDTIVPFMLKYDFTAEDLQNISDGKFSAPGCISKYGARGLEIDSRYATEEIVSTLDDFGIPFIVSGTDSVRDYCNVLLNGAATVIVEDIETATQVLDNWIDAMRERSRTTVE